MRAMLPAILAISALWGGAAHAADEQTARAICAQVEQQSPLPASLQAKILLGQRGDPGTWLFSIGTLASAEEAEKLLAFHASLAPCRAAMLEHLASTSSPLAEQRRILFARNERILAELSAQRISYGEANRRWELAQTEFEGLAAARAPATNMALAGAIYGSGISCGGNYSARC